MKSIQRATSLYRNSILLTVLLLIFLLACSNQQVEAPKEKTGGIIKIENTDISLSIDLSGGMYTQLVIKEKPLNPFGWELSVEDMPENNRPFVFKGHFLCTGRWGAPSKGEIAAGIPHNGEVNNQIWSVEETTQQTTGKRMVMSCKAPLEQLDVRREIIMPESGHYFTVKETFQNNLPIGRISNIVQHGTIAPPFLTERTIINTNATKGFDQRTNYQYLEDSSFTWPEGRMSDGYLVNLSQVTSTEGFVTTHIFEDSLGWITAFNPEQNQLLGYIWKTVEYPWLNVWHHSVDGKAYVQGLEFGTTGLGQPYELLIENQVSFFGRNSFELMDAGEEIRKSWIGFMVEVPEGFEQVDQLELTKETIIIKDSGASQPIKLSGNFNELWTK